MNVFFLIEDDEFLNKCNANCDKSALILKKVSEPVCFKFLKAKTKPYVDEATDFHNKGSKFGFFSESRWKLLFGSLSKRM